ncbi:hypothetical protein GCM10022247_64560 [Allokutzneria multivorans]|uniref:Secreted protein n=1 Tax=Allokutzneria multivorans TaxID=1142134 RepID=A0ABP7TSF0_9PSEU
MKSQLAVAAMMFVATWGMTGQAEAAPSAGCHDVRLLTGGEGHRGASARCAFDNSTHFRAFIGCKRRDNGHKYTHIGNRVPNGAWSTAWCDRNSDLELWGGYSD